MTQALVYETTNVGLAQFAALTEADKPVRFTKLAIGTGRSVGGARVGYAPAGTETALAGEFARFPIGSISRTGRELFLEAIYEGAAAGWVREVGLFIEGTNGQDVPFALWSSPDFNIGFATGEQPFLFMETVELTRVPVDRIDVTAAAPSLQLLFVGPIIANAVELLRLQGQQLVTSVGLLTPQITSKWR